jgi:hypothetical protein
VLVRLLDVEVRLVFPLTVGSPGYAGSAVLWSVLRTAVEFLFWAVATALIASAVCWCCGCGARAAWARIGPARPERPSRRARGKPAGPVPDACALEAARGIRELEIYLAAMSGPR